MAAGEEPSFFRELEIAEDELDDGFQAFERADEIRAVCPWASNVQIKCIAVFFRREFGVGR